MRDKSLGNKWIEDLDIIKTTAQAADTFQLAVQCFKYDPADEKRKADPGDHNASLQDVVDVVNTARKNYQSSRHQKCKKWLERFSSGLMYYDNIFNVLAQHHPEYVALAWGAMKFFFVAFLNHESVVTSIAKALTRIADALPRIQMAAILYQTKQIMAVMQDLYAHIIKHMIRAHAWYRKSIYPHNLHPITRPVEVRFQDLLEHITYCSRTIEQLAVASSQVESRDVHIFIKLRATQMERSRNTMTEQKSLIISHQTINSASLIDTNLHVSGLQFSEMIDATVGPSLFDHVGSFNQAVLMRNIRQRTQRVNFSKAFWCSSHLKRFADSPQSSLMLINGTFQGRYILRDAAVRITEELHKEKIPTIWAVNVRNSNLEDRPISPMDILKSLVAQALRLSTPPQTQKSTALSCTQLRTATTTEEWFNILGIALANLRHEIYLILELELLSLSHTESMSNANCIQLFCTLFQGLANRGTEVRAKVIMFTCRPFISLSQVTGNVLSMTMPTQPPLRTKNLKKQNKVSYKTSLARSIR